MKKALGILRDWKLLPSAKEEKPPLVLIGERDLASIENNLIGEGKLKVGVKTIGMVRRRVADAPTGNSIARGSIKKIQDNIIKKEVQILKKEGVARLFVEGPAEPAMEKAYAGYMQSHDVGRLKKELRPLNFKRDARVYAGASKCLGVMEAPQPLLNAFERYGASKLENSGARLFEFYAQNIARQAGIFDVRIAEEEAVYYRSAVLLEVVRFCLYYEDALAAGLGSDSISKDKCTMDIVKTLKKETTRIEHRAYNMMRAMNAQKERSIVKKVTEAYVPGSAVVCDERLLSLLEKAFSKEFMVKPYRIGEEFR